MDDRSETTRHSPVKKGRLRRWLRRAIVFGISGVVIGSIVMFLGVIILSKDLPELRSLDDYRPKQATVVYGRQGEVIARFATERRTVVPFKRIPKILVDAVVASEDSDFFKHKGVDYVGIVRCIVKNTLSGRKVCGASTITQQTVKTFLLSPERTYTRKLKEVILAKRVEEALEKNEILYLYLNQIYYGHGAYGAQEAAKVYFGKDVDDINVEEAALLAGLPQSPARLDPFRAPERALKRRSYVLGRLLATNAIDQATYDRAKDSPLRLDYEGEAFLDSNTHYAAHVKKLLGEIPNIGEALASDGGLKVYTGMDPKVNSAAERAVKAGLHALDKRQGWRGALLHFEPDQRKRLLADLETRRSKIATTKTSTSGYPLVWDLSRIDFRNRAPTSESVLGAARYRQMRLETIYTGIVTRVDDAAKVAIVSLGAEARIELPLRSGLGWARPFNLARRTRRPKVPSSVLQAGDVVMVRATARPKKRKKSRDFIGQLDQPASAESAVIVMDPHSREVRAMVGGYGIGAGNLNRAIQSRRQAGSTFKPLVYGAAFETRQYTPVTACLDAPRVYRDRWTGKTWKPQNYGGKFDGEISLRRALTLSKNLCSVELIDRLGVEKVIDMAQRAGIASPLPRNLTLALGSADVTPLEMVNAYSTLASGGIVDRPIFIRKVTGPTGDVLFETKRNPKRTISAAVSYQIASMMQSVVEEGTARRVRALGRPVAGKTGTTNQARNAWFIGFTPELVAGVWVGFDDNRSLGATETGGRAAIPIWMDTMRSATQGRPISEFAAPSDIVFALVDPKSGKLVPSDFEGARNEPFINGTEPTEFLEGPTTADPGLWPEYQ